MRGSCIVGHIDGTGYLRQTAAKSDVARMMLQANLQDRGRACPVLDSSPQARGAQKIDGLGMFDCAQFLVCGCRSLLDAVEPHQGEDQSIMRLTCGWLHQHCLPDKVEPAVHIAGAHNRKSQLALQEWIARITPHPAVVTFAGPPVLLEVVISISLRFVYQRSGVTLELRFGQALQGLAPSLQFAQRESLEEPGHS